MKMNEEERKRYIFETPFSNNQNKEIEVSSIKSDDETEKYPLCNICGKHADWLVIFNDRKTKKEYATTRCHEHAKRPEAELNNLSPYDQRPLWYGSWAIDTDSRGESSLHILSRGKVRSMLHSNISLLSNLFEEENG